MDIDFWKQRWDARQIAFHEGKPNDLLAQHIARLDGAKRALVPLAGKAQDMMLLASRGAEVVGVEAVETACQEFFDENGLPLVVEERDRYRAFAGGGITLLCGDMFDATRERLGGAFDAAYDRAALVALDPKTRERYVDVVSALLEPGARMFLVTFHYDQSKVEGPPWSVDDGTVRHLFADRFTIEKLAEREVERGPKFVNAGVDDVRESAFLLVKRA